MLVGRYFAMNDEIRIFLSKKKHEDGLGKGGRASIFRESPTGAVAVRGGSIKEDV